MSAFFSSEDIAMYTGILARTVRRILEAYQANKDVHPTKTGKPLGRPKVFTENDEQVRAHRRCLPQITDLAQSVSLCGR